MRDDIPFEVWHPIIQQVYSDADIDKLDGSPYVSSPLHQRLLIHRNLSLVSPTFRSLSGSIFMEELDLRTPESLLAVAREAKKDRHVARIPRKISFSFHEYRCGASSPRRKRELKSPTLETLPAGSGSGSNQIESNTLLRRRARLTYVPSNVRQPQHWVAWSGFVSAILKTCIGVSVVSIDATADYSSYHRKPNARHYTTLFGSLNLDNSAILEGLMACSNLRTLHLIDPSPLVKYGPALKEWNVLKELNITLSPRYPEASELSDTVFLPPRHLERFTLLDRTTPHPDWPLSSAIGGCSDMQYLHLGVLDLSNQIIFGAAKFLIMTYSRTLEHLVLEIERVRPSSFDNEGQYPPHDVALLLNGGDIDFPKLQSLRVLGGACQTSVFARMRTDMLEMIETFELCTDDPRANQTAYWTAFLTQPSLKHVKAFRVITMPSGNWEAFDEAREALGIQKGLDN